ncbi:glutamate racemase [Shewanella sp. C32]|uniref:Glutamate racemase n=1 Tax=Shewanella electrica TaxID=515560 RepID=A0ABT2FMC6_9GAMM|nr:glutamate racemase [Shewanella electrica]MCH1925909.1 glutamate racemase [Shewanella electrica]MCS4557485.1 glutamate racemase [Shewanella electrica]
MSRSILVFDSGVGGLSILTEMQKLLPQHHYHYLFDHARLPYGELDEQVLIDGCVALIVPVAQQIQADIVVIACNSASTLVLPALRAMLAIPVVGVVPAIKPAAQLSRSKHIGLLATPGTIKRHYTHQLIAEYASDCHVELFGSSELVMIAEQKCAGLPVSQQQLAQLLGPVSQTTIDVLVLGCTHFPMLKEEIASVLGHGVTLLDSGEAIARRVQQLLADNTHSCDINIERGADAYYTGTITEGLKQLLVSKGFNAIKKLTANGQLDI